MAYSKKEISRKEIYRYLGYRGIEPDETVWNMVEDVLGEITDSITPKSIYRIYDCKVLENFVELYDEDGTTIMHLDSKNLSFNLRNCHKVALLAATLGIEADKIVHKYELMDMAKASIAQAASAAVIEDYVDMVQEQIRDEASKLGLHLRPRYSPGYGDLALETQSLIFSKMEITKRLGLTLTNSLLMYPTKSVTAFIGFSEDDACQPHKCANCENVDCTYRIAD